MIKLQVIGHIGQDATINNYNGKNVCQFSVAHSEKYKNAQGVETQKTTWVNCSLWREQVGIAQYLIKGTQVYVEGSCEVKQWQGNDGKWNAGLQCRVQQVQLLGSKQREEQSQQPRPPQQNSQQESWQPAQAGTGSDISTEDDLPF